MKERPILFSAPMVRAILEGRKTQTRRVVKPAGVHACGYMSGTFGDPSKFSFGKRGVGSRDPYNFFVEHDVRCPYGAPGDRLWVRETWNTSENCRPRISEPYIYAADLDTDGRIKWAARWRPSIHMPRKASRITLEITGVRVERLQEISEADVFAEGVQIPRDAVTKKPLLKITGDESPLPFLPKDYTAEQFIRAHYAALWASINGPESWAANPWVWVVEFTKL